MLNVKTSENPNLFEVVKFPDGTFKITMSEDPATVKSTVRIYWHYEAEDELVQLLYIVSHLHSKGIMNIELKMPYLPNARMDRVHSDKEVFTLDIFCNILNNLMFKKVTVLDVHSKVSKELLKRAEFTEPYEVIKKVLALINERTLIDMVFFPDKGSQERYFGYFPIKNAYGEKQRDWETGKILGLNIWGESPEGKNILIVDDISSKGGTFYHAAKKLKELGAKDIYLYITHCENTILKGDLIDSNLLVGIYTTNSIFTAEHPLIHVLPLD